jgi:hypothetical protein
MFFRPKIERDPNIQKLEHDVFSQMQEIVKTEPSEQSLTTSGVMFVSFEQALRELQQMNK